MIELGLGDDAGDAELYPLMVKNKGVDPALIRTDKLMIEEKSQ